MGKKHKKQVKLGIITQSNTVISKWLLYATAVVVVNVRSDVQNISTIPNETEIINQNKLKIKQSIIFSLT